MKKHLVGLAILGMALSAQACNVTLDLPKTLPSLPVTIVASPAASPKATCDEAFFKSNDSDSDGALNISELNPILNPPFIGCPACGAPVFVDPSDVVKKYDKDGDGKLNSVEFCAYQIGMKPNPTPKPTVAPTAVPSPTPTFIVDPPPPSLPPTPTPSAVPSPTATPTLTGSYTATPAAFEELDKDKDGKVTWDEEVAYQTRNGALPAGAKDKIYDLFRQADTNANGTLERSEYDFARS